MTDGVNIDWSLLRPTPDLASGYANAFRAGRGLARQAAQDNAFRAGQAPSAAPPTLAEQVADLSPQARSLAAQRAEILGAVGQGLAGRPYVERRALLAHLAPRLATQGLPAAAVADFDPTDDNLAAVIDQAAQLRGWLAGND